ncbi:DUF3526 domain-containing protein [Phenylobacterium sp.]|uniref:DUF3526 domain-containing protein n=1 Tax=Phenylobacterium sp. TaxID=1871053 RepID=UPI00301BE847
MIGAIARRELALQMRDGRLVMTGVVLLLAVLAATTAGWFQFERARGEREHFIAEARQQWLDQGERHPHRAAHFGAYVAMPELSLAMFEPGLRPFAGQTLWLEAHDRPAFANIPSEDDLTLQTGLGVASGSAILQMLGGLLALTLGALAIVRDRESGMLRLALAQGVSPFAWTGGKLLGLATALALPLAPAALLAVGVAAWAAPGGTALDIVVRGLVLLGADALLLLGLLAAGVAISAVARSSRGALTAALGLWVGIFVLAPRAATTLVERVSPAPSLEAYQKAARTAFDEGYSDRPGYAAQLKALETRTLAEHKVQRLEDLPVGFSGIRMRHMDAWSTEVDDREYARLVRTYDDQSRIRMAVSLASPFVAARSVAQGMAGMDWPHHRDFLEAAETYRRGFGLQMNSLIEARVRGAGWEMDGDGRDWSAVAPFHYASPSAGWAIARQAAFLGLLAAWTMAALVGLVLASRRLRP